MSKFDELEERMFGAPIATSPHAAHISELAPAFSQPQYERLFHYYLDQYGSNPNCLLWQLKSIGPIQEGLALYLLVRGCLTVILIKMASLFLGRNPNWSLRHLKPIGPI
jgi:hypothetical protein